MILTRQGATIIASDDKGRVLRVNECRNVAGAIELELKLVGDPAFAGVWATSGEAKPPKDHLLAL